MKYDKPKAKPRDIIMPLGEFFLTPQDPPKSDKPLKTERVSIPWECPLCGGPRGDIIGHRRVLDGCKPPGILTISYWDNPCKHRESIQTVYLEAVAWRMRKHWNKANQEAREQEREILNVYFSMRCEKFHEVQAVPGTPEEAAHKKKWEALNVKAEKIRGLQDAQYLVMQSLEDGIKLILKSWRHQVHEQRQALPIGKRGTKEVQK